MADENVVILPYLDKEHWDITILALRMSSRRQLGLYLNIEATQPLHSGLLPDYNGLAECIGFDYKEICNFSRDRDPTSCLLNDWGNKPEMQPTLRNLVKHLLMMERVDVLEDCKKMIKKDAEHFLERKKGSLAVKPVQDQTVSQSPYDIDDMSVDETLIITIQDVAEGRPVYYDAFVCYNPEGEDLKFVKTMIEELETKRLGLKLFVPHRDDLPGASKHVISAKLIQERCKRMVIVMSPRYLQSDACDFQTKFAHALSPGSRSKKLVPILIQQCETPNILRHVTMCDYTRCDLTGWFWERLYRSLQAPLNPREITIQNPSELSDLDLKLVARMQQFSSSQPSSLSLIPLNTQQFPRSSSPSFLQTQQLPLPSHQWSVPPSATATSPSSLSSLPPSASLPPQLSTSPSRLRAAPSSKAGVSTQPQPVSFGGASCSGHSSLPLDLSQSRVTETYNEMETSFSSPGPNVKASSSSSAPASPSPSTKAKVINKKKKIMNKLTSVFSSSHHSSGSNS